MIKRHLLTAGAVWLNCMVAFAAAEDVKCSGVLVNEEGEPIIGATISIPGTKIVATTLMLTLPSPHPQAKRYTSIISAISR